MLKKKMGFNSMLVHGGEIDDFYGSATTPIYQTSTFKFKSAEHGAQCFTGEVDGYIYTRLSNPTIRALENALAWLENGYNGIATSSGMGAISAVYLTFLGKGDHLVSHNALYGPSRGIIETIFSRFGVEYTYVNGTLSDNIRDAIRPNTRMIFLESPSNPTMDIQDISAVSEIAKARGIPLCVDNTFCSPYLQQPLELGADIVVHSMTKFINGHADVVGGMIVTKEKAHYNRIRPVMTNMGFNMDPHQAYLILRGLKTLALRMDKAQDNAMKIAQYLESHPKVEWVRYPGLPSHPQHDLAKKQMKGPGGMISFELKGGVAAGRVVMNNVKFVLLAVSLGGIETLIQHPASMTHSKMDKEAREKAGITDGLVRLSVGIEDTEDIIQDLDQALSFV
jgi:methionine-gamma-lyase